jgi:hypothetical protein
MLLVNPDNPIRPEFHDHIGQPSSGYNLNGYDDLCGSEFFDGIELWGSNNITMSSGGYPTITIDAYPEVNDEIMLTINSYDENNHITGSILKINTFYFPIRNNFYPPVEWSESMKIRIFAHEIGHFYGLGHVPYSNQIMYQYMEETIGRAYPFAPTSIRIPAPGHIRRQMTTSTKSAASAQAVAMDTIWKTISGAPGRALMSLRILGNVHVRAAENRIRKTIHIQTIIYIIQPKST